MIKVFRSIVRESCYIATVVATNVMRPGKYRHCNGYEVTRNPGNEVW